MSITEESRPLTERASTGIRVLPPFIGRVYLYGLMAGGREGVDGTIATLRDEIERTMRLLGVSHLGELEPRHVTQLTRFVPVAARREEQSATTR